MGLPEVAWLLSIERGGPGPIARLRLAEKTWGLSDREIDVVTLLLEGMPDRTIAERLGISEATVKYHLRNMREKSGTESRTDLLARLLSLHHRSRS